MTDGSLGGTSGDDSVAFAIALYPVADPHARYQYALGRKNDPTFDGAARLEASSLGYFLDEAAMAAASVTGVVAQGRARADRKSVV